MTITKQLNSYKITWINGFLKPGESINIDLPEGYGQVVVTPETQVTIVRGKDNLIKTAIPKS